MFVGHYGVSLAAKRSGVHLPLWVWFWFFLNRSAQLLGWFMLAATIIPLADAAIVLRHGGTRTAAFGIHGVTAGVMLIISGVLLLS